jgi:cytochrome d ubiquinol oxidase subunit II
VAQQKVPCIVPPSLTLANSAAPPAVLRPVLAALAAGSMLLIPALVWLYRVFKGRPAHAT